MARTAEESAATQPADGTASATPADAAAATTEATPAAAGGARAQVILKLDEEGAKAYGGTVGQEVKRKDYILKRFSDSVKRGDIARELTRIENRKVPYQIVFQATKGVAAPAAPATPATPVAAAEAAPATAG
jgi:hypothetical protein